MCVLQHDQHTHDHMCVLCVCQQLHVCYVCACMCFVCVCVCMLTCTVTTWLCSNVLVYLSNYEYNAYLSHHPCNPR